MFFFYSQTPHAFFLALQGWVVKATAPIAPHTLLCEYTGQVDFARHHIFNSLDDTMDLIRSPHSATRSENDIIAIFSVF